jgi:hypothetical protein
VRGRRHPGNVDAEKQIMETPISGQVDLREETDERGLPARARRISSLRHLVQRRGTHCVWMVTSPSRSEVYLRGSCESFSEARAAGLQAKIKLAAEMLTK